MIYPHAIMTAMNPRDERRSRAPGRVLVGLFIGLGLVGLLALWTGIRMLIDPPDEPKAAIGPLMIGAILTGIGVIMPFVLSGARRRGAVRAARAKQRPGEPWTWREDWASGRITGTTGSVARALWLFVLVWNGFTWPVAWLFLREKSQEPGIYFVLFFPAVGVLLLFVAIRGVLQQRKYGASTFVLRTNPGVIGRTLEGDIDTRIETAPPGGFEVRLLCVRRYTSGRGRNRRVHSQTLWQDHVSVPTADLGRGPSGVRIPVAFAIPSSAVPTHDRDPEEAIEWRLVVNARTAGVNYSDLFEVPVFATGTAPLTEAEREALMAGRRSHAAAFVPERTVMKIVPSASGGMLFVFKPAVKLSSALGGLVMTVLCWAGTYYLVRAGVPIAPVAVGFIALLFTAGTVVALFHSSSVSVTDGEVVIRHRILGLGPTRRFARGQVVDIRSEVVGEGNAQSWEVKVHTGGGKSYSAGAMIPTQVEADWSADQLRAAVHPETGTATVS